MMKNGYSIYSGDMKFEIILDGTETASITLGYLSDPEHEWQMDLPFDEFLDYMKTLSKQFVLAGE